MQECGVHGIAQARRLRVKEAADQREQNDEAADQSEQNDEAADQPEQWHSTHQNVYKRLWSVVRRRVEEPLQI